MSYQLIMSENGVVDFVDLPEEPEEVKPKPTPFVPLSCKIVQRLFAHASLACIICHNPIYNVAYKFDYCGRACFTQRHGACYKRKK
jgi:hypothetical protein